MIRDRLLTTLMEKPVQLLWGEADYAAVHVRLGDFLAVDVASVKTGTVEGLRTPLSRYASVMRRLRELSPQMPIRIFSDGREDELAELLTVPGSAIQREPSDILDLLALTQARLLIGSNSTFSRWAAFLGNMPSIWFEAKTLPERPNDNRILYIDEKVWTKWPPLPVPSLALYHRATTEQRKLALSLATNFATRIPGAVGVLWFLPLLRYGLGTDPYSALLAALALGNSASALRGGDWSPYNRRRLFTQRPFRRNRCLYEPGGGRRGCPGSRTCYHLVLLLEARQ